MKMWIINRKDYHSFDQLYNINSLGKVVEATAESLKEYYISSNMCFIIEDLIEIDETTTVPVLDSVDGFLSKNPVYGTLRELSNLLTVPIELGILASLIMEGESIPPFIKAQLSNGIPNVVLNKLDSAKFTGVKGVRTSLQVLMNFRYNRLPDSYLIYFLQKLVENKYLNPKLVELFSKVTELADKVQEIRNGKRF